MPYKSITGKQYYIFLYALDYNLPLVEKYYQYLPNILRYYEKTFGEYPFWDEKMAFIEGGYRGMEHQTCLNIDELFKLNPKSPWSVVLAHELAHEWWGNLVTASDMSDAWIHEGFATYSEALLAEHLIGDDAYKKIIRSYGSSTRKKIVGRRNVCYNSFQNNSIYFKGALILHQLRTKLNNDDIFFKILRTFLEKYRFRTVMTEDFINHVNEVAKDDYTFIFEKKNKRKLRMVFLTFSFFLGENSSFRVFPRSILH